MQMLAIDNREICICTVGPGSAISFHGLMSKVTLNHLGIIQAKIITSNKPKKTAQSIQHSQKRCTLTSEAWKPNASKYEKV